MEEYLEQAMNLLDLGTTERMEFEVSPECDLGTHEAGTDGCCSTERASFYVRIKHTKLHHGPGPIIAVCASKAISLRNERDTRVRCDACGKRAPMHEFIEIIGPIKAELAKTQETQ